MICWLVSYWFFVYYTQTMDLRTIGFGAMSRPNIEATPTSVWKPWRLRTRRCGLPCPMATTWVFFLISSLVLLQSVSTIPHLKREIWNYILKKNGTSILVYFLSRAVINFMHDLGPHPVTCKAARCQNRTWTWQPWYVYHLGFYIRCYVGRFICPPCCLVALLPGQIFFCLKEKSDLATRQQGNKGDGISAVT